MGATFLQYHIIPHSCDTDTRYLAFDPLLLYLSLNTLHIPAATVYPVSKLLAVRCLSINLALLHYSLSSFLESPTLVGQAHSKPMPFYFYSVWSSASTNDNQA